MTSTIDLQSLLPLLTGSGGALVVLGLWVLSLKRQNDQLMDDLKSISRDSIECITKVIEKEDAAGSWREDVMNELRRIMERINHLK